MLYPEHNEYIFEDVVIKLTVTEMLSSSYDNPVPEQLLFIKTIQILLIQSQN